MFPIFDRVRVRAYARAHVTCDRSGTSGTPIYKKKEYRSNQGFLMVQKRPGCVPDVSEIRDTSGTVGEPVRRGHPLKVGALSAGPADRTSPGWLAGAAMWLPAGTSSWPRFQRAIASCEIGDADRQWEALLSWSRAARRVAQSTSVKQGAVGNDLAARGRWSVTNLGRLSQRVTGGCDRFFWLVTRGSFLLSHCHTYS